MTARVAGTPDDEPGVDPYANADEADVAGYEERGFVVHRRENHYLVPTRTVRRVSPPAGGESATLS